MIKLKELVKEVYEHPLYGSDKVYFEVMKPFDLYIAVGGMDEKKFSSWLQVNISGFGLGSNLYQPGMLIEEVKLKAQQIVRSYDQCIIDVS